MDPNLFLSIRFWLGALLLTPLAFRAKKKWEPSFFWNGLLLGISMFLGMFCQTLGLKYTTASNSGFLTALSIILVPIWSILFFRRTPTASDWLAIVLATAGVCLLTANVNGKGFNQGDLFTVLSAVGFSFQIILIEKFVQKGQSLIYAWMMLVWTALFATMAALGSLHALNFNTISGTLPTLIFLGVFATAAAFWGQTYFQPQTSATAAVIIYAAEPVFATLFAWLFLSEKFSMNGWIGSFLILSGIVVHEAVPSLIDYFQ